MLHAPSPSRRRRLPPLPRRTRTQNAVTFGTLKFTYLGRSYKRCLAVADTIQARSQAVAVGFAGGGSKVLGHWVSGVGGVGSQA
jgi:hypothetical protein